MWNQHQNVLVIVVTFPDKHFVFHADLIINSKATICQSRLFNLVHAAALKSTAVVVVFTFASIDPVVERVQDEIGINWLLGMGMKMRGQNLTNVYCPGATQTP